MSETTINNTNYKMKLKMKYKSWIRVQQCTVLTYFKISIFGWAMYLNKGKPRRLLNDQANIIALSRLLVRSSCSCTPLSLRSLVHRVQCLQWSQHPILSLCWEQLHHWLSSVYMFHILPKDLDSSPYMMGSYSSTTVNLDFILTKTIDNIANAF